jgi:hypothetical protein
MQIGIVALRTILAVVFSLISFGYPLLEKNIVYSFYPKRGFPIRVDTISK